MMIWNVLLLSFGLALAHNVEKEEQVRSEAEPKIEFQPVAKPAVERNISWRSDYYEHIDGRSEILKTRVSYLGDIALTEEQERSAMRWAKFPNRRWPNGNVGICIKYEGYSNEGQWKVYNCVQDLDKRLKNCGAPVRMVGGSDNCIEIHNSGGGCWSHMGMTGGRQPLSISEPGCMSCATIQHEIMHAIGFGHEQGRQDRDCCVEILWGNIPEKWRGQYNKDNGNDMMDIKNYDYFSVMHYPWWAPDTNPSKDAFRFKYWVDKNKVGGGDNDGITDTDCQKIKWRYENWDK